MKGANVGVLEGLRQVAMKGASKGVEVVKDGVDHVKESADMSKEAKKILTETDERQTKALTRQEVACEEAFEIAEVLFEKQNELYNGQIARYQRQSQYDKDNDQVVFDDTSSDNVKRVDSFQKIYRNPNEKDSISAGMTAGAMAAAAVTSGAAAIGLTTAFGVASTGTAISALSGAAAMNATLAALGGGAVAAGGTGIAGGIVALGGIIAIPALAVGGFMWDKNSRENYKKAKEYKDKVDELLPKINENRNLFLRVARNIQSAIYEITNTQKFLDNILDIYENSMLADMDDSIGFLCKSVYEEACRLITLNFIDEEGRENQYIYSELSDIHENMAKYEREWGKYIASLDREESAFIEQIINKKVSNHKVTPIENREIADQLRKVFIDAQECICIMSPWIGGFVEQEEFFSLMEYALKKSVRIKITYGIGNISESDGMKDPKDRNQNSENRIKKIKNRLRKYGDNFRTSRGNSHGKLLICDDSYYIIGSFNFLSFEGTYLGNDQRGEIADMSSNPEMILHYKNKYFNF